MVRDRPDARYAHHGDVAIAYQVFGEGSVDLVCVPGFVSNLYWNWELPEYRRMLTGLGSFARVVIVDRRGVGLSDRLSPKDLPSLEVVMDDILAVMDDAGTERAAVFGWQSGATHVALLAATYPDRVTQLVTFNLNPCPLLKPDWPYGFSRDEYESYLHESAWMASDQVNTVEMWLSGAGSNRRLSAFRRIRSVPARCWTWPEGPSSWTNHGWLSPDVA